MFEITKLDTSQIQNLPPSGDYVTNPELSATLSNYSTTAHTHDSQYVHMVSGSTTADVLVYNSVSGTWIAKSVFDIINESEIPVITTEKQYTKRVDFYSSSPTTGDIIFKGWANIGVVNSSPTWRILKLTINTDGDITEQYANGNNNFDNIWNDRLTYTYI